jgi:hypothetical protein
MKVKAFAKWAGTLFLIVTLAACGGGDDGGGSGGTPGSTQPVIGAAGGTVQGPIGSKIVIPPGALATDTPVEITESSAGAPAFPGGFVAVGPMFAFTPHGTTFAVPVTVTLPFDPSTVPAGKSAVFLKTTAGRSAWEEITDATFGTDTVTVQISGFSNGQVGVVPINTPFRDWKFKLFTGDGQGRSPSRRRTGTEPRRVGCSTRLSASARGSWIFRSSPAVSLMHPMVSPMA